MWSFLSTVPLLLCRCSIVVGFAWPQQHLHRHRHRQQYPLPSSSISPPFSSWSTTYLLIKKSRTFLSATTLDRNDGPGSNNADTIITASTPAATSITKAPKWYPTRIQEDVDYEKVVKALYLRHILVETSDTAKLVLEEYLKATNSPDPFGQLASTISACLESRKEGGKIGWIDLKKPHENDQQHPLLPNSVFQQLIQLTPKMGDVHVLKAAETDQVHLVKVEELLMSPYYSVTSSSTTMSLQIPTASLTSSDTNTNRVGSHSGTNIILPRSQQKLKGKGVLATSHPSPKTFLIQTNGCQMNVADSERLQGILQGDLGLRPVDTIITKPDVVIINTCSIRDHAEQKLYDILGPHRVRKRNGEPLTLIVTGCVAQQEGEALVRKIPELDVVLGPQYVPFLSNILEQLQWNGSNQVVVTAPMLHHETTRTAAATGRATSLTNSMPNAATIDDETNGTTGSLLAKPIRGHPVKGFVNTILGCNEHCTYCVVPATRGMEQSRPMEAILQEILELIPLGYKEITLLGQNIDAYGRDMVPKRSFAQLLEYLDANIPSSPNGNKMRIRYTTSHPRYMSDKAISAIAHLPNVCEGYHVPFQAGDNHILRKMRRGYTHESYLKVIEKIRQESPDAGIFADVIVGFPGETDDQFERTLDLMKAVKFDNLNAFMYSTRPNTEAALWEDQVPEEIKKTRLHKVQELAAVHGLERSERYVGKIVEVLVEDANPRNPQVQVMGRTRQGRQVYFDGCIDTLQGAFVDVKITHARTWSLLGERV